MSRSTRARTASAMALVAASAIVVSACGSEPGAGGPPPPAATDTPSGTTPSDAVPAGGVVPTTGRLTDPPSTAPAASTPGATASAGPCRAGGVVVGIEDDGVAAGHRYRRLVFTNTGSVPCALTGYPGVSFRDAEGRASGGPATREAAEAATVTVAPGAEASAVIDERSAEVYPADACGDRVPVVALRVYLPDDTEAVTVPSDGEACPADVGQLSVRPVQAGRDSQP